MDGNTCIGLHEDPDKAHCASFIRAQAIPSQEYQAMHAVVEPNSDNDEPTKSNVYDLHLALIATHTPSR